ncbi:hypothetical protein BV898_02901 [Hypsibius exemplaris]|uniref:Uncharacterized protein n=1 Tax=Hypsibius exemplaris TaxID=2072580 RepID=A0A1W0X6I7_HYPEX|nr:hypothetical protein BV898_02901 [Hypsibius exemplaris]
MVLISTSAVRALGVVWVYCCVGLINGQADLVTNGSGSFTIESAVNRLNRARIFSDDHQFMRRVAWIMTKDGGDPKTFRQGYNGGIWQIDKDEFFLTQTNPVAIRMYHPKIQSKLGISWPDVHWSDLRKPFYSLLAARLKLAITTSPGECRRPIPTTTPDQASYFARCFAGRKVNTVNTRNPQAFLMAISQCQRAMACRTNTF